MQVEGDLRASTERDFSTLAAGFLAIASVVLIAAAVVRVFGFGGVAITSRIYAAASQSSLLPAVLAVGAVALLARRTPTSWPVTIARIAALIIIATSLYGIGYALLARHEGPQALGDTHFIALITANWSYRVGDALVFVCGGLVAIAALTLSLRSTSTQRHDGD